jgi:AbrB family looped-hinge helix DNA binding protein
MASAEKLTTTVSTKGQVILPSAIRQRREWSAGTRLLVEETVEGVLLKPAPAFTETRPEDVFASLPHHGKPKTLEETDAGVLAEARRRHARNWYQPDCSLPHRRSSEAIAACPQAD